MVDTKAERLRSIEVAPSAKMLIVNLNVDRKPHFRISEAMFESPKANEVNDAVEVIDLIRHPEEPLDIKPAKAKLLLPFSRVSDYAGIVLTGSQLPPVPFLTESGKLLLKEWKYDLFKFIQAARDQNVPLLGICFGAEAIAEALGGKVDFNKDGGGKKFWEVGVDVVRRCGDSLSDPILSGLPDEFLVPQNHDYTVERLPEGGELLLENKHGVQGFRAGNIWGFQFHPEKTRDMMLDYLNKDDVKERIERHHKSFEAIYKLTDMYDNSATQVIKNFLHYSMVGKQ